MNYSVFSKVLGVCLCACFLTLYACEKEDSTPTPNPDPTSTTLTPDQLRTWLDNSLTENPNVPGAVALVDVPGQIEWMDATGLANTAENEQFTTDHQFIIASLTKPITATAVLQLVEEGQLQLDAKVSNWLDLGVLNSLTAINGVGHGADLTVRQLLNHTSGIFDYLNNGQVHLEGFQNDPSKRYTLLERVLFAQTLGQAHATPGDAYFYSNTNYILLGMLLETIEGKGLEDIFQTRIFQPLEMTQSFIAPDDADIDQLARGYFQDFDITDFTTNFNWGNPAGGVVSTVEDLSKFIRALSKGELFQKETTLNQMLTFNYADYGLGVQAFLNGDPHGLVWGHDGGDPGYFSFMIYMEKVDAVIIYAGNRADIEVEQAAYFPSQVVDALAQ